MQLLRIEAAEGEGSRVLLAELLGAFSYALDLTEGQPPGHCIRSCWIGTHVGQRIGLPEQELQDLYYTLLLKDLGCSSNAARVAEIYLADERVLKQEFKLVGPGLKDVLGFVLAKTGRNVGPRRRLAAVARILRHGGALVREVIQTRCTRGADIARQLRFPAAVADGIFSLDEHWDGSGQPQGLHGHAIPIHSRIALIAQIADVFRTSAGREAAIAEVRRRSGSWLDPELVNAFTDVARDPAFWRSLASPTIEAQVLGLEPARQSVIVDEDYLDAIAAAFGGVVDAKSPYTGGHSQRVATYVDALAARLDVDPGRRRWLHRGALLHDIGKLGVSNAILDKPAKLDNTEWVEMRSHAAHTREILSRISCFHDLAPIAAAHHERLDGTGYPLRLDRDVIGIETRIITIADYYDALTADRPYRAAMPVEQALDIIGGEVGGAIDPACFAALREIAA
jgi:HD-GYP domain-containing protein (c-di-GMP phosphodiesterase class II)